MNEPAVRTTGLHKQYGDLPALQPLDLVVDAGERVSLIGHNGSGKTTLIRLLSGRLDASDGDARLFGHEPGSIPARASVSLLADEPAFYDDLSVIEHLEYIARLHGDETWRSTADDLLERVGLTERADDLPVTFSRGLKQKAAICFAFVRPFDLLLVDEPFVGLDATGRAALLTLFDDAHQRGKAIVVATHELTTVAASQRVIALRDGAISYDGPPRTELGALVEG